MSDTIDEQDAWSPTDPPPRREPTGSHRADDTARIEAAVDRVVRRRAPSQARAIAAIVIAALGSGGLSVAGQQLADAERAGREQARDEAQDERLERVERQVGDVAGLQRDVASLTAKVDAWRSADVASRAAERADLERRLARMEALLDRRR